MNLFLEILSASFMTIAQIYIWYKLSGNKLNKITIGLVAVISLLTGCSLIKIKNDNELIRPMILIFLSIIGCRVLLKEKVKNCIVIVFCQYLLVIILEALFGVIALFILNNNVDYVLNNIIVSSVADIIMGILLMFVVNLKIVKKLYSFILRYAYNLKSYQIVIFLLLVIVCSIIIFSLTYFSNNILVTIIINIIITFIYLVIVLIIIKTKNNYIAVIEKYNTTLDNIQAQESIIDEYRIMNHENKNNLTTIKTMSSDKRVVTYINSLLDQNDKLKNNILIETLNLPECGIRGLIYNKLLVMQENDIKYILNIDKKIKTKVISGIDDYDIVDICQILGVFLDNAIDEAKLIADKIISIDFHLAQNDLIISIVNNYKNELANNYNLKTTKGKGHGYGLKLVKKILERNNHLKNEREFSKGLFVQKLILKLNNE